MIKHLVSPALAALAALILPVSPAAAANNCIFKTIGTTLYLKNNCETDSTIVVPAGTYFTGGSFTISTVDPAGGYFVGPVVSLAGAGTVTALNIALNLGTACEANDTNRRIGLLLDGSSGTVTKTTIVVNRDAASTCSDGVGIEIRNDGSTPVRTTASIKTSSVSGAYWTGIRVRGNVNPRVDSNKVTGAAVTVALAQAGITLTEGAQGLIIKNTVLSNGRQSPKQVPGVGIVLDGAAIKTSLNSNTVQFNDIGIR